MRDRVLIISLNVQNLIVSNAENIQCRSFIGWIGDWGCATNIFVDILLQNLRHRSILSYSVDAGKMTRMCDSDLGNQE
jgi:hypothetical protein